MDTFRERFAQKLPGQTIFVATLIAATESVSLCVRMNC
jgi:hypothetical protein